MDSFSTTSSSQCAEHKNEYTPWPSSTTPRHNLDSFNGEERKNRDHLYMRRYLAQLEAERDVFLEKFKNGVDYLEDWRPIKKMSLVKIHFDAEATDQERPLVDRRTKNKKPKGKLVNRQLRNERRRDEIFLHRYLAELECQREDFIKQFQFEDESCELGRSSNPGWQCLSSLWSDLEVFICNMPLTIGALGLGWVTQGVVWFKFMEENSTDCVPVRFNSPLCSYPEFPGCFDCNTSNPIYVSVVTFHYFCHVVGFVCCALFFLRAIFATRAVVDELTNPATSTPMGVVCITVVCVCAGRGQLGEAMVIFTSAFHFFLALWFLYTAIWKFRLLPDPGWFPNSKCLRQSLVL